MISAGSADNSGFEARCLEEWDLEQRPRSGRLYEFYNVLWIEWKGDIAYRKAWVGFEGGLGERGERVDRCDSWVKFWYKTIHVWSMGELSCCLE